MDGGNGYMVHGRRWHRNNSVGMRIAIRQGNSESNRGRAVQQGESGFGKGVTNLTRGRLQHVDGEGVSLGTGRGHGTGIPVGRRQ